MSESSIDSAQDSSDCKRIEYAEIEQLSPQRADKGELNVNVNHVVGDCVHASSNNYTTAHSIPTTSHHIRNTE